MNPLVYFIPTAGAVVGVLWHLFERRLARHGAMAFPSTNLLFNMMIGLLAGVAALLIVVTTNIHAKGTP